MNNIKLKDGFAVSPRTPPGYIPCTTFHVMIKIRFFFTLARTSYFLFCTASTSVSQSRGRGHFYGKAGLNTPPIMLRRGLFTPFPRNFVHAKGMVESSEKSSNRAFVNLRDLVLFYKNRNVTDGYIYTTKCRAAA